MGFSVTFLGTGAATPSLERGLSATIANIDQTLCLFDCGEGTQIQMKKFQVKASNIQHIFISHLHGDHYFGLIGLLFTYHIHHRINPLHIYGPPQLEEILRIQLEFSLVELSYPIIFQPLNFDYPLEVCDEEKFTVTAFPLKHRIPTYGFLLIEKERPRKVLHQFIEDYHPHYTDIICIKLGEDYTLHNGQIIPNHKITLSDPSLSFAYCFDTSFYPTLAKRVKNVDLLYHEATFMNDNAELATEKGHSTTEQAATIAKMALAKHLVLGHISSRYRDRSVFLNEARAIFPKTDLAEDGMTIILRK
ncbi:MAG: ribonuclease Z [Prolixibacteraceae bacterium]|nr:ribonuclease Z [Prolixibacteraceae bacterium]